MAQLMGSDGQTGLYWLRQSGPERN